MHTFIGVKIPAEYQNEIQQIQNRTRHFAPFKKWVSIGDYHITLAFLGETSPQQMGSIKRLFGEIQFPPSFFITLNRINIFGQPTSPRVLFLDLETSPPELIELKKKVDENAGVIGFKLDNRPYNPHITLGKRWDEENRIKWNYDEFKLNQWLENPLRIELKQFQLFSIHPKNEPKYHIEATWDLAQE